ncbi:hypothetical protein D9M70_423000 [compost metagenome]
MSIFGGEDPRPSLFHTVLFGFRSDGFLSTANRCPGQAGAVCIFLDLLSGYRAVLEGVAQEVAGLLQFGALVIVTRALDIGQDVAGTALDAVAPQHAGSLQPIAYGAGFHQVADAALIVADVRLGAGQDADIRVLLLGGHQHGAGEGAEGLTADHPIRWRGAAAALAEVADAQHGAPVRLGKVHHGLECSTDIVGPVHVALHHVDHRIEQQERGPTNRLHGLAQQIEVRSRVEGFALAQGVHTTLDDVDALQVSAGRHQAGHQRIRRVVLG